MCESEKTLKWCNIKSERVHSLQVKSEVDIVLKFRALTKSFLMFELFPEAMWVRQPLFSACIKHDIWKSLKCKIWNKKWDYNWKRNHSVSSRSHTPLISLWYKTFLRHKWMFVDCIHCLRVTVALSHSSIDRNSSCDKHDRAHNLSRNTSIISISPDCYLKKGWSALQE